MWISGNIFDLVGYTQAYACDVDQSVRALGIKPQNSQRGNPCSMGTAKAIQLLNFVNRTSIEAQFEISLEPSWTGEFDKW